MPKYGPYGLRNKMAWSVEVERQIETLGRSIEKMNATLESEFVPLTSPRLADGAWSVSLIVETAVTRTARKVGEIRDWEVYKEDYLKIRDADSRDVYMSDTATEAINRIFEHLERIGFDQKLLFHAGKVNKRLIIAMCLSIMVQQVGG